MPTRNRVAMNQLLPILLSEKVHPTGGSLQLVPALTPRASSPAHWSSIAQPPCYTASYASGAPPLSLRGGRVVQAELLSDHGDLGMISRIPHAAAPGHLAGLEQKFSTYLSEVAAGQHVPARLELLYEARYDHGQDGALHILWCLAKTQGAGHAEEMV